MRYVILSFEDNADADTFIADTLTSDAIHEAGIQTEVVGLFAVPTIFCDSSGAGGCRPSGRRLAGFSRGMKYGWWVCAICKKPVKPKSDEKLMRQVIAQGRNFITQPLEETAPPYAPSDVASVNDVGWGVSGRHGDAGS